MPPELRPDTAAPAWWSRAEDDLSAAETLLRHASEGWWTAAFHAQQAAEKYLKAFLVAHGYSGDRREFRTHEIDDLRGLVAEVDGSLSEDLASADALSEYAVESRYPPMAPGIEDDIDTAEAREAVALARLVREAIHPRISAILPGANPG